VTATCVRAALGFAAIVTVLALLAGCSPDAGVIGTIGGDGTGSLLAEQR
jgi:hypothetical protein